jgi:hypothetical protein
VYVALCTGRRDNVAGADAWEHHRAIVALVQDFWHPGNPTYATDEPSIRYCPYIVSLALICRQTGLDPYDALSAAAAVNTVLLMLGVRWFLAGLGHARAAGVALLVMISIYGRAPGYANSYALADLPWHQVNPSAFAFGLVILGWCIFQRFVARRAGNWAIVAVIVLQAVAMLDHAMTGVCGAVGLGAIALCAPRERRWRLLLSLAMMGIGAGALCLLWPWYSFRAAITLPQDPSWFNPGILQYMLLIWCPPAIILSLASLTCADRPVIRLLLMAAAGCYALALAAMVVRSPTLARLPLPGLIFLHLAIGIYVYEAGLLLPRSWPARVRELVGLPTRATHVRIVETSVFACIVFFLAPQVVDVLRKPHLARGYIARLVGRDPKLTRIRDRLADILEPVGTRDTVLCDPLTAWAVPSIRGRIVAAMHYEYFTPNQGERARDVARFLSDVPDAERIAILDKYSVRWILLNPATTDARMMASLIEQSAVVAQEPDGLVLMDAGAWRQARTGGRNP